MKLSYSAIQAKRHEIIFISSWGLCLGLILALGVPPDTAFVKDVAMHLDSVWRIAQGQVPHHDYFASSGYDSYHLSLAVLSLFSGFRVEVFHWFQVTVLAIFPWLIWLTARRRFTALESTSLAVGTVILLVGLQPLGWSGQFLSSAMYYNKVGLAALLLFIIRYTRPAIGSSDHGLETAGVACFLAWMMWFKLPYALSSIAIVLLGVIFKTQSRRSWQITGLAAAASVSAFLLFLRGDVLSWWKDFSQISEVYSGHIARATWIFKQSMPEFVIASGLCIALFVFNEKRGYRRLVGAATALVIACVSLGVLLVSTQWKHMPLLAAIPFIAPSTLKSKWKLCISALLASFWVVPSVVSLGVALSWETYHAKELADVKYHVRSAAFEGVAALGAFGYRDSGEWWVEHLNDGIAVLRRESSQDDRVVTLDYSNPFPVALRRPSAIGGSIVFQDGFTHNAAYLPEAERLFANANVIMIPIKGSENPISKILSSHYYDYLQKHFSKVVTTRFWEVRLR